MGKIITILAILMCLNVVANAQVVKGVVYDQSTGEPVAAANVSTSERPSVTVISNDQGKFSILLKPGETLLVTMVGYETFRKQYATVPSAREEIYLERGLLLKEVMVTASLANSRSKRAIGANVDHIDATEIVATANPPSLANLLNGRISGAQVYNTNGKVGMPIRFDIRSAATFSMERDPLIFIDGVRYHSGNTADINSSQEAMSALNDLPLNDIESIDVIKGPAATASYGSEAANGVIVIKTKRNSKQQSGLAVNVRYTGGLSHLARKYDQFVNNKSLNDFFRTGEQHQLYANLSARLNANSNIFFSANTNTNAGTIPGNTDRRQTIRAGYDFSKDRFKISLTTGYVTGKLAIPQSASGRDDAIWNLMRDTVPWPFISEESWHAIRKEYKNDRFTASVKLNYTFPFNIKAESLLGLDLNQINGLNYLPYGYLQGTNSTGSKQVSNRKNQNMNWDFKLSRNVVFDARWQLNLSLLSQFTRSTEKADVISVRNFATPAISNIASAAEILSVTDSYFEKRTHGLYGEAFVNYNNRLFVNAGLRRDVSNMIGRNVASIWYPTLSIAYNLADMDFLKGKIDNWKLRAAYGESGRLPYPNDAQTAYLVENSSFGTIVKPSRRGNPNIRPERTGELEFGTDISLFKQQIGFTYYYQNTRDAIVYTTLIPSLGWPSTLSGDYPENIGRIKGKGVEVTYNGRMFTSSDKKHSLDLFANFNYQSNKVVNAGGRDILSLINLIREGLPAFSFYTTKSEGAVFDASGKYTGAKESGLEVVGKPFPTYNGSFGFALQLFSNLRLQSLFTYAQGAKVYNIAMRNVALQGSNLKAKEDLEATLAALTPGTDSYIATATALSEYEGLRGNYVEKADYLRLSNLTISYDLSAWAKAATGNVLKHCMLSVTANNLWLTTNYGGAEPLIDSQGGSKRTRGISYLSADWTAVPMPRTYAFSLNIGF
ncbi:MAG: TonB-dependent receptor domain-containing protein [Agriterribacter sp.]